MERRPAKTLFIEPFYGGSHRQLVDLLQSEFGGELLTLPASKWHWRMRVAALHFSLTVPRHHSYQVLFASSVLNLCELTSLRPDLARLHKVLYFHENQLVYPVRKVQERDFQYGYNQILSCLVADVVVFNSVFNMESFLDCVRSHLSLMPDYKPKGLVELIKPKCKVLYFPIQVRHQLKPAEALKNECTSNTSGPAAAVSEADKHHCTAIESHTLHSSDKTVRGFPPAPLHIVWPHRWEHDKGPEEFCAVLVKLLEAGCDFHVSFLGDHTSDVPECIQTTLPMLGHRLLHKGRLPVEEYWRVLQGAHVAVSTAKHEFFGVAMLEATYCGCYPLCPNRLVYPEIYPSKCLYNTEQQLFKTLKRFCRTPTIPVAVDIKSEVKFDRYLWSSLRADYGQVLQGRCA